MYTPHGSRAKHPDTTNLIKYFPLLFQDIDFGHFFTVLGIEYVDSFVRSSLFMMTSKGQSNHQARLLMLISSIESIHPKWEPLESMLKKREFRKDFCVSTDVNSAYDFLSEYIDKYNMEYGSFKRVFNFFRDNATVEEKKKLINGINLYHMFEKSTKGKFTVFMPRVVKKPNVERLTESELDKELNKRIRKVVYEMRNEFVHRAMYFPFPAEPNQNIKLNYMTRVGMEPRESWIIDISFNELHDITKGCYERYWKQLYTKLVIG